MFIFDSPPIDADTLIDAVIDCEARYVNHPADRGGPTCWRITEAVARGQGYHGDMRKLRRTAAIAIYRQICWLRPGFDKIALRAPQIAAELFDTGVNMGTGSAVGFLQRALNSLNRTARDYPDIAVDRDIDPRMFAALDGFLKARGEGDETVLLRTTEALGGRYIALAECRPSQEAFLFG
ncbi:glycosyl hydrolase 108 family protein [Sphingopyxis sp.]|uniref:glycoside hydrolase family 108 protein n=1 Tax=Sphingopyxis sp. TaxID=1908224 RepID=UPI001DF3C87E|nr:glycosyl hydrolase 108 family protein [Sphingopyxis sp.]MBW8295349.1 hypothetical protein [Sphingopyxis sp.]